MCQLKLAAFCQFAMPSHFDVVNRLSTPQGRPRACRARNRRVELVESN